MNEFNYQQINKYDLFGISNTKNGNILKLGTLLPSGGNLSSIKKNIKKQITSKLKQFNLEYIHCIKTCIPKINENSEQAIKEVITSLFPNDIQYFIDSRNEFPNVFYIKILFNQVIDSYKIFYLGNFLESTGSENNIKKNIIQQFDKLMSKKKETMNLDLFNMIEFMVPIGSNPSVQNIITNIIDEKLQKKSIINKTIDNFYLVQINLIPEDLKMEQNFL